MDIRRRISPAVWHVAAVIAAALTVGACSTGPGPSSSSARPPTSSPAPTQQASAASAPPAATESPATTESPAASDSPAPIASASAPAVATVTIHLVAGPVCPVERDSPDPACAPRAVPGAVVVLRDARGAERARASSDANGIVTFAIAPGTYELDAAAVAGLMGRPQALSLTVAEGAPQTLTLEYDTGIR